MLQIDQAFTNTFINSDFNLPIAFENLDFEPDFKKAYAEIKVLQNDKTGYDTDSTDETDGVFRIVLRYPINKSSIPAKKKADQILNFYKIGSKINYDGVDVIITSSSRSEGVPETGWYKLVLTIGYKSFLRR